MGNPISADDLRFSPTAARFEGADHGSTISFFLTRNPPGTGPGLHRHPYEETFVVHEGSGTFTVGDEEVEAHAGQIVVVPAETPHKFVNSGEGELRVIGIHPRERVEQEWLEED